MKFYETSIKAMEKVLRDTKEDFYADYIKECIQKWESSKARWERQFSGRL